MRSKRFDVSMFLLAAKSSLDGCCLATYVARNVHVSYFSRLFYSEYRAPLENVHCRSLATRLSKYFKIPTPWGKPVAMFYVNDDYD